MYKIIGADQKEYGPVSADDIRQWIAEGRAGGQTMVQIVGNTDWRPLSQYPEFAAVLATSPSAAMPPVFSTGSAAVLPADILDRDYDIDVGACVSRAWRLVMDNFGIVVGGTAIYMLIQIAINILAKIPILGILVSLASLFITGPLMGGLYYFIIKNIRREAVEVGDVFSGFKTRFVPLMVTYLVQALISGCVAIPGAVIAFFGFIPIIHKEEPSGLQIVLIVIGVIVMLIPLLYLSTSWIFSLPLVMDKQLDFWAALETSRKVVGKHWWLIFVLVIVGGLITLASILLCCLPVFIGVPVTISVLMYAYEDIFGHRAGPQA